MPSGTEGSPSQSTPPRISAIVVGAGIGGLTVALLLARIGAAVTVLEREQHPAELGAGLMLQPNGMAVLDGLGLLARVEPLGCRSVKVEMRDANDRLIIGQTVPDLGGGFSYYVAMRRHDLHRVLLDALSAEPTVELRAGTEVLGAEPGGVVRTDGSASQLSPADIVVGADGIRSIVRSSGNFGARVSDRRTTYVRGLIPQDGPATFVEHWTPLGAFGAAQVADGITYFYVGAYRRETAEAVARRDLASLRDSWHRVLPAAARMLDRVTSFEDLIVSGVRTVRCRRWVDRRLVLLGDAAHAMAPNAGQGANSAMLDAVALASEVAAADSVPDGLRAYEIRRRSPVSRVQRVADVLAVLSGIRARPLAAGRDLALKAMGRTPGGIDRQVRFAQQEDPVTIRAEIQRLSRPI